MLANDLSHLLALQIKLTLHVVLLPSWLVFLLGHDHRVVDVLLLFILDLLLDILDLRFIKLLACILFLFL